MFNIESYVTPILLSYVDKYVKDFRPADAQVSIWGGGVVLSNLVIKTDVLQQEVPLPFTLISGRIHELLIQVPWHKIMSEPIVVTIDTIECILNLRPPDQPDEPAPELQSKPVVQAPPGYMQALVRRIVSNIVLRIHHLIVKYVEDDIVLSLNVKMVQVNCADDKWQPAFADIDPYVPVIRRLVTLEDLTLCLDRADADGKIRFYQEPLLYRCQLSLRVVTRLISANLRRAASISVQLRSSKLAWGVTRDQLTLLLRILDQSQGTADLSKHTPPLVVAVAPQVTPLSATSGPSEPPSETWSDWAWSWLPTWSSAEGAEETPPLPPTPIPMQFLACFDSVSFVFKIMETESGKKKARGVLELQASNVAAKGSVCVPTTLRASVGIRTLVLNSHGKCVCGHVSYLTAADEPTIYLHSVDSEAKAEWSWPEQDLDLAVSSGIFDLERNIVAQEVSEGKLLEEAITTDNSEGLPDQPQKMDELWKKMEPVILLQLSHDRSPPFETITNLYENIPKDFEYSDWAENFCVKVTIKPLVLRISMGLIHRLLAISGAVQDIPRSSAPPEPQKRTLTVEEVEALLANLPQRRVEVECRSLSVQVYPWDHSLTERSTLANLAVEIDVPLTNVVVLSPMYPLRVCSAASQLPADNKHLQQASRLHVTLALNAMEAKVIPLGENAPASRPIGRANVTLLLHSLLHKQYFAYQRPVLNSFGLKIKELNICGSSARLQTAWQVINSLITQKPSIILRNTTLLQDTIEDEGAVAIDIVLEDLIAQGFLTEEISTFNMELQSIRIMALHKAEDEEEPQQAWLFSGPDTHNTTYLKLNFQWCDKSVPDSLNYLIVTSATTVASLDTMLHGWLAYRPAFRQIETQPPLFSKHMTSTQYFMRRRYTPPSSSGRGPSRSASGTGADMVHTIRPRSLASSSEERRDPKAAAGLLKKQIPWYDGNNLVSLHARFRQLLVRFDLGLILVYLSDDTASAVNCDTISAMMEAHVARTENRVLVFSVARLLVKSNDVKKLEIHLNGPTYIKKHEETKMDLFPWKISIEGLSCSTLEIAEAESEKLKMRSPLKLVNHVRPKTILESVEMTVTVTVVTRTMEMATSQLSQNQQQMKSKDAKKKEALLTEEKLKYFKSGVHFKPTTLKEFVRGPANRRGNHSEEEETTPTSQPSLDTVVRIGPVMSIGVNVHADTPPIVVRLNNDQVPAVGAAMHSLSHLIAVMKKPIISTARTTRRSSESEVRYTLSDDGMSETRSELDTLFESPSVMEEAAFTSKMKPKTFFWFQWVISRATVVVTSYHWRLAFNIDDIITSVDIQTYYNQFKLKFVSASVKHHERDTPDSEWKGAVLGGRVLEAREPTNSIDDNHFLAVTVTQAQTSNLPDSWKEELHPKLLQNKNPTDSIWEIYVTLAPLEAVLRPKIIEHITLSFCEMQPLTCPMKTYVQANRNPQMQWPFVYVVAGGLRLLLHTDSEDHKTIKFTDEQPEDTFMLMIDKIEVNPHPENPICRRPVGVGTDINYSSAGGPYEGRQYEVFCKSIAVHLAQFTEIVKQEETETNEMKGTASTNPALKWAHPQPAPVTTPIINPIQINCLLAPPHYMGDTLVCGPAIDISMVTDCLVVLSVEHVRLLCSLVNNCVSAISAANTKVEYILTACRFESLIAEQTVTSTEQPDQKATANEAGTTTGVDSGVETVQSFTVVRRTDSQLKKNHSVLFPDDSQDPSDYLEIFVTMGVVELSLYAKDDSSPEVIMLRTPKSADVQSSNNSLQKKAPPPKISKEKDSFVGKVPSEHFAKIYVTEDHLPRPNMLLTNEKTPFRKTAKTYDNIPLIFVTLFQPNMYYWRRKCQNSLQVSLFDIWVGLGNRRNSEGWHATLVDTKPGASDPVTDIPPALATMKLVTPNTGSQGGGSAMGNRGTLRLDVERPISIAVSEDRLKRLRNIIGLIKDKWQTYSTTQFNTGQKNVETSPLYNLRQIMLKRSVESIIVQTTQFGVAGADAAAGWEALTLQVAAGSRPDRLVARTLVTALLVSVGQQGEDRQLLLHPIMLGSELEATWEPWRKSEKDLSSQPSLRLLVELDHITVDLKPEYLCVAVRLKAILDDVLGTTDVPVVPKNSPEVEQYLTSTKPALQLDHLHRIFPADNSAPTLGAMDAPSPRTENTDDDDSQYYKDDLRSGVFVISTGNQLPMAYQAMLKDCAVLWRYPHPRAITTLVAYPLPTQNSEVHCVLEHYSRMLERWEPISHFELPVNEPREIDLYVEPPLAKFAVLWRVRVCDMYENMKGYLFNRERYEPRDDPLISPEINEPIRKSCYCTLTAEQLCGVLRVDSLFSPRLMPRLRSALRLVSLDVHVHNSLPAQSSQSTFLEGYYVSKPLMKSHRVVTFSLRDSTSHLQLNMETGLMLLINAYLSIEILDCATGAIEQFMDEARASVAVSFLGNEMTKIAHNALIRYRAGVLRVIVNVPRLKMLNCLAEDWIKAVEKCKVDWKELPKSDTESKMEIQRLDKETKRNATDAAQKTLNGRICLWVHNTCATALRIGQVDTDQIVPLGPGIRLAYRWRSPTAPKLLKFSFAGPANDSWSSGVSFTRGTTRLSLGAADGTTALHVSVEEAGSGAVLSLSGAVCLANMLRFNLLFKVKSHVGNVRKTICFGELETEHIGRSVICPNNKELLLKVKISASSGSAWSGDIPLRECPKENVPWLVKVPTDQDSMPYVSVWCRVIRGRNDGRLLATFWPLYVLHSHIPLDTDVLITSTHSEQTQKFEPMIQCAKGRGVSTHLVAPGTTAVKHSLTFQYRSLECPVTREAVPMHYGVTNVSVFDKYPAANTVEDILDNIREWLQKSDMSSTWPYSTVRTHWPHKWVSSLEQPRCDVNVNYAAVCAGGGCCLELRLTPVVILCNASLITLMLRANDAASLCRVDGGAVISPPSTILHKPFFISIEEGRETFVSPELSISDVTPGVYGTPPPGVIVKDNTADTAVNCYLKVALLTLYYEVKHNINILGVSSTFLVINKLPYTIVITPIAVPQASNKSDVTLQFKSFDVVSPTEDDVLQGSPLPYFWLHGRWQGSDVTELATYLGVAIAKGEGPAHPPVPLRLATPPVRATLTLNDGYNRSVPAVVTQQKHEGRWVVTISLDPCPQFLVHNQTKMKLAVAQPIVTETMQPRTKCVSDCEGVRYYCTLDPDAMAHYSTPAHCARYPDSAPAQSAAFVAIGAITPESSGNNTNGAEEPEVSWSAPVAITIGEQLVPLPDGATIKVRVHPHPHSTLLEMQDITQDDISASDIRRRLLEPSETWDVGMETRSTPHLQVEEKPIQTETKLEPKDSSTIRIDVSPYPETEITHEGLLNIYKDPQSKCQPASSESLFEPCGSKPEFRTGAKKSSESAVVIEPYSDKVTESNEDLVNEPVTTAVNIDSENLPSGHRSSKLIDNTSQLTLVIEPDSDKVTESVEVLVNEPVPTNMDTGEPNDSSTIRIHVSQYTEIEKKEERTLKTHKNPHICFRPTTSESSIETGGYCGTKPVEKSFSESTLKNEPDSDKVTESDVKVLVNKSVRTNIDSDLFGNAEWASMERIRGVCDGFVLELGNHSESRSLMAAYLDRVALIFSTDPKGATAKISVAELQIENLQYETGQFDFAVIASTRVTPLAEEESWPPLWAMFLENDVFDARLDDTRLMLQIRQDSWTVAEEDFSEITELEIQLCPLALYVEDAYITALVELFRSASTGGSSSDNAHALNEAKALRNPLRLRTLHMHPLDLTLTLHTAVRMYIALDQSPLRLSAFKVKDMMTSVERLTHGLTVHYLSAAILGAGWVVGGLELLGAPGALATRVSNASGGVRGLASAAAAALLRSLSACAGSLARNLDLLAGDEEHARRAAAARRRPPDSLLAGLAAGLTNFAINILGAVGGLAHHPVVGPAVGETASGASALRRGLVGALAKPLSATADLVAYAGHGLLTQTGWDPLPKRRDARPNTSLSRGWRRDCVRWSFRLAELTAIAGYDALLEQMPVLLLLTHKFLVIADIETERIIEMIDFRFCTLAPYDGLIVTLYVAQSKQNKVETRAANEDDEYQLNAAAMARVARYTGAATPGASRALPLHPSGSRAPALHAALRALLSRNSPAHAHLL